MAYLSGNIALLLGLAYYVTIWNRQALWFWWKGLSLPPGPPRKFIFGNKHQLPRTHPWLTFTSWCKSYGPIQSFEIFNRTTILLSSTKVVTDLLEARSSIYSDRPSQWMGKLAGRGKSIFLLNTDDPRFSRYRRLLQSGLSSTATRTYRPIQAAEVQVMLNGFLDTPEDFIKHIRRNAVAIILKVAYGYSVTGVDDHLVQVIENGFKQSADINLPGKYLVETFPILRFVPDWFPGAGFKRRAKVLVKEMEPIQKFPYEWAVKDISTGQNIESFTSLHLKIENGKVVNDEVTREAIQWTSAALYVGGGDTTVSALVSLIFLMCTHPEVQKRAQNDIDKVAPHRLPTLDDIDSLPYIVAIVKEILRWGPPVPLGLPHKAAQDDIYDGYFIPKGATVLSNIWAITRDESIYPNPSKFDPERHLGENPQPDPMKYVFGYGRRVCPGAHFAEMSLFLNAMNILAVFDILKPLDKNGKEVNPKEEWISGVTMHLKPFECRILPRSADHLMYLDRN